MRELKNIAIVVGVLGGVVGFSICAAWIAGDLKSPPPPPERPPFEVDAATLERDYGENEIAADTKYKGRLLVVSGIVASVEKGILDQIVVKFGEPHSMGTEAFVDSADGDLAGKLKRGEVTAMLCRGAGYSVGTPILRRCRLR